MKTQSFVALVLTLSVCAPAIGAAQTSAAAFDLAAASRLAALAAAEARTRNAGGSIAVVGAIGISGAHNAQEDDDIAQAAVNAFAEPPTAPTAPGEATYLPAARVSSAFLKGMPLLETVSYKIHASRREAQGLAEVHARDTDIIYVLDGSVTFVTGGTVVDPKIVDQDEIRGTRIEGGTLHALNKGDVIVVPAGTPHWFYQVDETFLYFVVKASEASVSSSPASGGAQGGTK